MRGTGRGPERICSTSPPLHNRFKECFFGEMPPLTCTETWGYLKRWTSHLPSLPGSLLLRQSWCFNHFWETTRRTRSSCALPVDGGCIPHIKAGGADLLQKRLGQFRRDVINRVQLLGGIVIADKQPNLVDKDRKNSEEGWRGPEHPPWWSALCSISETQRCPVPIVTDSSMVCHNCFGFLFNPTTI